METWKDVAGYEGLYEVSDKGNVRNKKNGKILKGSPNDKGYLKVHLFKNGKSKTLRIHRLVADAFISNPDNKPFIDHIDTDRTNNNVDNLRWCTQKENCNNPITKDRTKKTSNINALKAREVRKKKVLCITTGQVFDSASDASRFYNLSRTAVGNAANPNHKLKTAGNLPDGTPLTWKYIKK